MGELEAESKLFDKNPFFFTSKYNSYSKDDQDVDAYTDLNEDFNSKRTLVCTILSWYKKISSIVWRFLDDRQSSTSAAVSCILINF
jgi:hypothetical protein